MAFPIILKTIGWLFSLGGAFVIIAIPIINGMVIGFKNDNWNPLIESTAGAIFNSDQIILRDATLLADEEAIKNNPQMYNEKFVERLKSEILTGLIFMVSWYLLIYWLLSMMFKRLIGEQVLNISIIIVIGLLALLVMAGLEFAYSLIVPPHKFVIPLSGLLKLILNPQIWAVAGTELTLGSAVGGFKVSPIEVKEYTIDKPFESVKNPDGTNANISVLGRPKKLIEFFCQTDNDCIQYFSNPDAKCQASTGVCYS